jgi:hypothetical protein
MNDADLPTDIESCHALICKLRGELEETRRKLSVYVENERREYEWRYGKGVTPQSLLAFGEMIARKSSQIDPKMIEGELAADDEMRRGARKKK